MSARDDLPSKQKGFQLGIDDYMVKPVDLDELVLRVRALLRRANIEMERKITVGNLVLDADGMSAEVDGEEISLTNREFNIIFKLLLIRKKLFPELNVSHEMKTPIAIIKNYAELLQMKNASEEEKEDCARNIEEAAGHLSALISIS